MKWNEIHFKEKKIIRNDYVIYLYHNIIKDFYEVKTIYYEYSWKKKEINKTGLNKEQFLIICEQLKIKL